MKSLFLSLTVLFMAAYSSFSQKSPIEYGEVPLEEIKMQRYEKDTTAEAVVLCQYGEYNEAKHEFTTNLRIKILKKSGLHWGNYSISGKPIYVQGVTYNYENGKVVYDDLDKESIFHERIIRKNYVTRISMPNVKEGSVIDIKYLSQGIPLRWNFQKRIPVRYSEIRLGNESRIGLKRNLTGAENLTVIKKSRLVAENLPALEEEPFMKALSNYATKLEIEIANINYTTDYYRVFGSMADSWASVEDLLLDNEYFGKQIGMSLYLNNDKKQIEALELNGKEKIKAAYDLVKRKVKWNKQSYLYTSRNLRSVYKENVGNSADINLILCNLLQKLGFEAYPVALSTRNNGLITAFFPTYRKLDYVIVAVNLDDERLLLDASEKYLPMGLLPERCINERGKIIQYNETDATSQQATMTYSFNQEKEWAVIKPRNKKARTVFSNLVLLETGELQGKTVEKYNDYAAYDYRKEYENFNSKDSYIDHLQEDFVGLHIEDLELENLKDIYKPVVVNSNVSFENQAQIIGDMIYINPLLNYKMEENPFNQEGRKYPIDFIYPVSDRCVINIDIPSGYAVEKIPQSVRMKLPGNGASFSYKVRIVQDKINLMYSYQLDQTRYTPNEYGYLKSFFSNLYKKQNEMIILKKNKHLADKN